MIKLFVKIVHIFKTCIVKNKISNVEMTELEKVLFFKRIIFKSYY